MQKVELPAQQDIQNRWPTFNTSLASALLVYGYNLCQSDPYLAYANYAKPDTLYYSLWFNPAHPQGIKWIDPDTAESRLLTPQDFEVAWIQFNDLVNQAGRYTVIAGLEGSQGIPEPDFRRPLMWMRRGIEQRHRLLRDFVRPQRREETPEHERPKNFQPYKVDDLTLAFVCCALGLRFYKFDRGEFTFDRADAVKVHQMYLQDGQNNPAQWAKRAIIQQDILIADLHQETRKNSDPNVPKLVAKNGLNLGFLPVNCGQRVAEQFWKHINMQSR